LVQCLHEIGAKQPLYHNPPPAEEPKAEPSEEPEDETTPSESTTPPAREEDETPPAEEEVDPFGGLGDAPADEAADEAGEPAQPEDGNFGVDDNDPFAE
jgi:hypothetical protein